MILSGDFTTLGHTLNQCPYRKILLDIPLLSNGCFNTTYEFHPGPKHDPRTHHLIIICEDNVSGCMVLPIVVHGFV